MPHGWHQIPGLTDDGRIDAEHLTTWVRDARLAFAESNRADIGDEEIGRVLSASPAGSDGIWPAEAVRELMETIGNSHIEGGFVTGRYNSRSGTTRGAFDGGTSSKPRQRDISSGQGRPPANGLAPAECFVAEVSDRTP